MKNAPGLKTRRRADGSIAAWWVASNCSRHTEGFTPRTISLDDVPPEKWPETCRWYHQELKAWLRQRTPPTKPAAPTIASMIDQYLAHELSPYQRIKYNSRASYDHALKQIRKAVGEVYLRDIRGVDFMTWHAKQKEHHGIQGAYSFMAMLKRVLRWAVVLEIADAKRLVDIVSELEFEQCAPRTALLTYRDALAIIAEAHRRGRPSIALAQAIQFELTFRQKDVIGEWIADMTGSGIRHTARNATVPKRWESGLLWSHIDESMILRKMVSKTAKTTRAVAEFDLRLYPLVLAEMERVPAERRIGPMILNEETGQPYTASVFRVLWREIATAAGISPDVQNRDSRAGGVTEGTDAGASLEQVRHHATHASTTMTGRYSRNTIQKTSTVARLRVAARTEKP